MKPALVVLLVGMMLLYGMDALLRHRRDAFCRSTAEFTVSDCALIVTGDTWYYGYHNGKQFRIRVKR